MEPSSERWRRMEELFARGVEIPPEQRTDWLAEVCAGDEALRQELSELLAADEAHKGALRQQVREAAAEVLASKPDPPVLRAGPYRLTRELGHGGMGAVYLGERDDGEYDAQVAVKLIRPGLATQFFLDRFKRERQALARLVHPNIARLYDSGTTGTGVPFIVMELVQGVPITEYAKAKNLSVDEILKLYIEVCRGVSHAHTKQVVHRDLKPRNIFVQEDGTPKLLDFGICKLTEDQRASETVSSAHMLTPDYASPEQVRGEPVTAASDVYSLGAVLYELLTGRPPRLLSPGRDMEQAAKIPEPLNKVVLKALALDPKQRYATVDDFAEDLRRVLDGEQGLAKGRPGSSPWRRAAPPVVAAMGLLAAALGFYRRASVEPRFSIAVLPFACFSTDSDAMAFAGGLTEEVTARLAQNRLWRVAARTSAQQFENKVASVRTIGEQLNVGTVLEGSVRKNGGRIRITAQLINTKDGYHLWSANYDREGAQWIAVQEEVSGLIAADIEKAGGSSHAPPAAKSQARELTERARAVIHREQRDDVVQRGPAVQNRRPLAEIVALIEDLRKAAELDANYSDAYSGLALAYLLATDYDEQYWGPAKAAAERAIDLDRNSAEGHFAAGYVAFLRDWDFPVALREFTKALELDPRDVGTSRLFADCSALMGNPDAGIAALDRARKFIPDSEVIAVQRGIMLYHARRFGEMLAYSTELVRTHSNLPLAHWLRGLALEQMGKYGDALAALEECLRLSPRDRRASPALGHLYGQMGRRQDALQLIETARGFSEKGWIQPTGIALIYAGLGNKQAAMLWMEQAFQQRDTNLPYLKIDPRADPLRSEARFQALLGKLRL